MYIEQKESLINLYEFLEKTENDMLHNRNIENTSYGDIVITMMSDIRKAIIKDLNKNAKVVI